MSKGITIVGEPIVTVNGVRLGTLNGLPVVTTDRIPNGPSSGGFPISFASIQAIMMRLRNKGKKCIVPKT